MVAKKAAERVETKVESLVAKMVDVKVAMLA